MAGLVDRRAHKITERLLRSAREPRNRILANGKRALLDALADGRTVLSFDTPGWDPVQRANAFGQIQTAALAHLWDRHRIIYAVHPTLVAVLANLTARPIPGEIWQMVPHTEPLVTFPEPVPATLPDGKTGRLVGFFVHGRRANGALSPVHDTARVAIGLHFFVELPGRATFDVIRTTVRTDCAQTRGRHGFYRAVAFRDDRRTATDGSPMDRLPPKPAHDRAVLLLYTCTDPGELDLRPLPQPVGRNTARRPKPSSPTMFALGWQRGPALYAARQRPKEHYKRGDGGGWRQPPHQRACSLRVYWTGEGRRVPIMKLIAPYLVSQDLLPDPDQQPVRVIDVQ